MNARVKKMSGGVKKMAPVGLFGTWETSEGKKIEISFEKVFGTALIFTNAFFVYYFFAKLFQWI